MSERRAPRWLERGFAFWNTFWFAPTDLSRLGRFRLVFGLAVFWQALTKAFDFEFLFTDRGILKLEFYEDVVLSYYRAPIHWQALVADPSVAFALYMVFLLGLLLLALGVVGRGWGVLVFVLHLIFMKRNPIVHYGADFTATCWLLYLGFARSNATCTLRDLWKRGWRALTAPDQGVFGDALDTVVLRFIQIHLCIIYAYGGFEKLKGMSWWRGDALWLAFGNGQYTWINFGFLHAAPSLIAVATIGTLFWEIYFPVLVWNRRLRPWVLGLGLGFHAVIALAMQLPYFSIFMVSAYLAFWSPAAKDSRMIETPV